MRCMHFGRTSEMVEQFTAPPSAYSSNSIKSLERFIAVLRQLLLLPQFMTNANDLFVESVYILVEIIQS